VVDSEVMGLALDDVEIVVVGKDRLHCPAIEFPVGLGSRSPDGRTLASIEQSELDTGSIRNPTHQTVQGIDFPDQMALSQSADSRIAGHDADCIAAESDQSGRRAHACGGSRGLASRMATADNDNIIFCLCSHYRYPSCFT